jgi:Methyltransferase domain
MRMLLGEPSRLQSRRSAWWHHAIGRHKKREPRMSESRQQRLEHFNSHVYGQVEGWLGDRMWQIVNVIGTILDTNGVYGNIAEFGVHHGLFLFLLNTLRNDDEACFAIDVFDEQRLNVDSSGRGSLSVFLSHVETLMASQRHSFRVVQRDTMSFSITDIVNLFGEKGVKFFSIDAGHTIQHARNDLTLAQEVLVPGGVIALDDYMSVHWPGVTEGFYRFMDFHNRRLKPFLFFQNKLFLTTASEHGVCLQQLRTAIEAACRDEVRCGRWKQVEIAGSDCLSFA